MARTLTIRIVVGEPTSDQVGLWCDTCALPTVCEFPLTGLSVEGVWPFGTIRRCVECGGF